MTRPVGIVVGAAIGFVFSTLGFIRLYPSLAFETGGNEWTPVVIGAGVVIGAAVGGIAWTRRHAAIPLGAFAGLIVWMLFRDYTSFSPRAEQPAEPVIVGSLFVAVLVGAGLGWLVGQRSNLTKR